jgi:hypothetical protein
MPTAAELQSSNEMIFPMLALPDAQARRPKLRGIGYGVPSDFELNFGRYLPSFGRRTRMTRIASTPDRSPGFYVLYFQSTGIFPSWMSRQAIPRSESSPSKYPINSSRKYTPGIRLGRPRFPSL